MSPAFEYALNIRCVALLYCSNAMRQPHPPTPSPFGEGAVQQFFNKLLFFQISNILSLGCAEEKVKKDLLVQKMINV